jgi:hypothetical protein
MKPPSQRFSRSRWTEYVAPAVLVFLLILLIATLVIILAAVLPVVSG